uniref:Uncharacterized protein n=1 Tax=Oryza meridionalis TaxID=40149 RepID=A0A0E0E028_9ORYZ
MGRAALPWELLPRLALHRLESRSWSHANMHHANVVLSFQIRPCCIDQYIQHDDSIISIHGDIVYPDKNSIICRLEAIEKYFSLETVKDIVEAMESEASKLDEDCCTLAMK